MLAIVRKSVGNKTLPRLRWAGVWLRLLPALALVLGTIAPVSTVAANSTPRVRIDSVQPRGPFEGIDYLEAQATLHGTVTRPDGTTGSYQVPLVLAYPANPAECNGTALMDLLNSFFFEVFPTAGAESVLPLARIFIGDDFLFSRGTVYAGVEWNKMVTDRLGNGTIERATDGHAILRDVAQVLRNPAAFAESGESPIPCAASTVIAFGYSQPGQLLRHFIRDGRNADRVFDGVLVAAAGGRCRELRDEPPFFGYFDCPGPLPEHGKQLAVNSESDVELVSGWLARDETPSYRIYEIAGAAHIPGTAFPLAGLGATRQNPMHSAPVFRAILHHLEAWIREGTAPPPSRTLTGESVALPRPLPRVTPFAGGEQIFCFQRDDAGNAIGGIRLPDVEAPLGTHRGIEYGSGYDPRVTPCPSEIDPTSPPLLPVMLGGAFEPFSASDLHARYPNHGSYVAAVSRAAQAAFQEHYILEEDAETYVQAAAESPIGQ